MKTIIKSAIITSVLLALLFNTLQVHAYPAHWETTSPVIIHCHSFQN